VGPNTYVTLGTDGFGSLTTRPGRTAVLQHRRRVRGRPVLEALARDGEIESVGAVAAARQYKIDDVMAAGVSFKDTGSA